MGYYGSYLWISPVHLSTIEGIELCHKISDLCQSLGFLEARYSEPVLKMYNIYETYEARYIIGLNVYGVSK